MGDTYQVEKRTTKNPADGNRQDFVSEVFITYKLKIY